MSTPPFGSTTAAQLTSEGIAAFKRGNKDEALRLLVAATEADSSYEQAWLWLSGVVDEPADRRLCLENVLTLNPENKAAQRGLAQLRASDPPSAPAPALPNRTEATTSPAYQAPTTPDGWGEWPSSPVSPVPAPPAAPAPPASGWAAAIPTMPLGSSNTPYEPLPLGATQAPAWPASPAQEAPAPSQPVTPRSSVQHYEPPPAKIFFPLWLKLLLLVFSCMGIYGILSVLGITGGSLQPAEPPPPGWVAIEGPHDLKLWAPDRYVGGASDDLAAMLEQAGLDQEDASYIAEQSDETEVISLIDSASLYSASGQLTVIEVHTESSGRTSLNQYMTRGLDLMLNMHPETWVISRELHKIGAKQNITAERVVIGSKDDGEELRLLSYIFQLNGRFWDISFSAEPGAYDRLDEEFEQIMRALSINA